MNTKENYIPKLFDFLHRLERNNNRPWFQQHKNEFDTLREEWLSDLDRIIAAMTTWYPEMSSQNGKSAAYRIYRDTRFSPDKTPYKTYFSAAFSPYGRKTDRAGFYLEMSPFASHPSGVYGGIWCIERPALNKLRHAIVDNIEEWEEILDTPDMRNEFPDWCSSMLKTIPKGWDRNHPQAFYLRMTNYGKYKECSESFFLSPDWPERVADLFHTLYPFIRFLNYSLDEEP